MSGYFWAGAALMTVCVLWTIGRPAQVKGYTVTPVTRVLTVLLNAGILALLVIGALHL